MMTDVASAVAQTAADLRNLQIAGYAAEWDAATHGTPENLEKSAQTRAEWMRYLSDQAAYERYRDWDQSNAGGDNPLLARQIRVLHRAFAQNQQDAATIEQITKLMMTLTDAYTNFRGQVDGKSITNNAIEQVLEDETDNETRQDVWEASKQIGPLVSSSIRELARLRNQTAHKMGSANFHSMSLRLCE